MKPAAILFMGLVAWTTSYEQQPQRDPASPRAQPASSISGTVLETGGDQTPVRRVVVTLRGPSVGAGRLVITDSDGQFAFPGLPAGNFTLEAVRPGYVRTFYGSTLLGRGPGLAVALGNGETVSDVTIHIPRGGVVSGTVRDAYGRPQANAEVSLIPVASRTGAPDAGHVRLVRTDDAGSYRAYGLTPGSYVVAVQPGFNYNGAQGYAPVFFPGTTDPRGAAFVPVETGHEATGIDLAFQFVQMTRLQGRLVGPPGTVLREAQLRIEPPAKAFGLEIKSYAGTTPAGGAAIRVSDGAFQRSGLAPGRYRLIAQATATDGAGTAMTLWGLADLDVAGQEVVSTTIELHRTLTVTGTVEIAQGGSTARPSVPLLLRSAEGDTWQAKRTPMKSDGTFSFQDVTPGRYWIDVDLPVESKWRPVAIALNQTSLIDVPLTVTDGQNVSGVRLTLSNQPALDGRLIDSAGRSVSGYVIVVFSSDRNHWTNDRRAYIAKPASNGRYLVPPLPEGEYLICAAPDVDADDLRDPAFLDLASHSALKVAIVPGRTESLDLQIPSRGPAVVR